jgi:hypothetical protein
MALGRVDGLARRGRWIAIVSLASILGWAVPALHMLNKGFAVEDEGTYVLSYRFWHSNPYFEVGSQYVYGPVFEALGESIPLLRLLRLVMIIGVNAWFGRTFLSWLARERQGVLPGPRVGLLLLLTASGGTSYLWAPLTPGYYDLTADASLVLITLMLLTLVGAPRVAAWVPVLSGVVSVALVLTKWTAAPVLVITLAASGWALLRLGRRAAARYAVLVAAGAAAALVACQVFLTPIGRFATITGKVSTLTKVGNHTLAFLVRANVSSTLQLLSGSIFLGLLLLAGTLAARDLSRRGRTSAACSCLVGAALLSTAVLPFVLGWHGGAHHGRVMFSIALGGLVTAVVAGLLARPRGVGRSFQGRVVAVVLVLVPFVQAAGTNVSLPYVAFECLAAWVAAALMLATDGAGFPIRSTAVVVNLAVLVVGTAMIGGTTTLKDPFKTTGLRDDTSHVPALGVSLSQATAGQYAALATALRPYVVPDRTPMITLDQKAGLTYLLHGFPAGSTWTDAASPTRTAGILELACRNGDVPAGHLPVLVLDRPVDRHLARAMRDCGFGSTTDYRRLPVPGGPPGLSVYVHRS